MPNTVTLDMNTPSVQYLCKKDIRQTNVTRTRFVKNAENGSLILPLLPAFSIEHWIPD